jgi:hypothetical protein
VDAEPVDRRLLAPLSPVGHPVQLRFIARSSRGARRATARTIRSETLRCGGRAWSRRSAARSRVWFYEGVRVGNTYGRVIGILAGSLGAIGRCCRSAAPTVVSLAIFALCVYVVHSIIVHGQEEPGARNLS